MADGLPSGTVTFLFTDVVDSTLLWETSPEAMRATIAGLDDLTRETIGAHEGKLVKSVGDGAMAVFQDAERAVAAAVDLQRQLDNPGFPVPVKVRIGLHTGQATPVDGDYLAPAVNRAARIAGAAHGGQILVSDVTATLVERTSTLDLGDHHLKGLEPQRLHQVIAAGLPADFPALATAIVAGVALPSPPTSFIGRADIVSAVAELLREHPLVTLTGTPGSGKTRLAIAIAQPIAEGFPDGVVFADLATVTDERGVTATVAQALGLAAELTDDPVARISAYLAQRSTLCILDNCEHVIDATAHLARRVVEVPGRSRLLATSREPIGVLGEQVYRVASLDLETEAVQLFVERAREAKASFRLDEDSKHQVLELCRRLDGIPLAIELAAARVTHLAPAQLVDLLDDRLRVLAGGRGRIQRHQTLMATLDWSFDLLHPPEQHLLPRLAIFPASFPLEAVEAVGEGDVLEPLAALVDKSLVQVVEEDGRLRYRLLETVRLYGLEKLVASGEARTLRHAHRDHVRDWLEAMPLEARWFGDRDVFAAERPSVSAALHWAAYAGDDATLAALATGFDWTRSADWKDGLRWCELAAQRIEDLPRDLRVRTLFMRGMLSTFGLDRASRHLTEAAFDAAGREAGPLSAVVHAWLGLNTCVLAAARREDALIDRSMELADDAAALSRDASDPWRVYCCLIAGLVGTALLAVKPDLRDRTEGQLVRALEIAPDLPGYDGLRSAVREYLGLHRVLGGDAAGALRLVQETSPNQVFSPMFGPSQAVVAILAQGFLGEVDDARDALRTALDNARRVDLAFGREAVAICAGALAAIAEDWERASRLLAVGTPGLQRSPESSHVYFWTLEQVRAALDPERRRAARAEGIALGLDRALAEAVG